MVVNVNGKAEETTKLQGLLVESLQSSVVCWTELVVFATFLLLQGGFHGHPRLEI